MGHSRCGSEVAGVGPITAPQRRSTRPLDEALCNRLDVRYGRPEPRDAIGTSQLDPPYAGERRVSSA